MNIKSKIAAALAIVTLAGGLAVPTSSAQAGGNGWGLGAAIVGGAVVGGVIANSAANAYYVDGPRRCYNQRQFDAYGYYVGTVRVCRY